MVKKKEKPMPVEVGKRKTAIARTIIKPGTGKVTINSMPLDFWGSEPLRLWIKEPLMISNDVASKSDIYVNVKGGGVISQAEAIRQSIAKSLVKFSGDKKLKNKFFEYDRNLLVYDYRRTEPHHSSGKGASKRGSRRHKQRSKR